MATCSRMTPEQRFKCMSHNRAKDSGPELRLRHALWHRGFRYRINVKALPGSPDIVLPKYRSVIFVHGCFWHGHNGCKNYTVPKTNTDFWVAKVARNRERDQEVWRKLEAKGWRVIIVWECQLKKSVFYETVDRVVSEVRYNRESYLSEKENRRKARLDYHLTQKARKEKELALKEEVRAL